MLNWSKGLRSKLALGDEKSDQELVDGEEQPEPVAVIPSHVWDGVRGRRGIPCALLEAAELAAGPREGHEAIQALIHGRRRG
jgi:hypothetical protein